MIFMRWNGMEKLSRGKRHEGINEKMGLLWCMAIQRKTAKATNAR